MNNVNNMTGVSIMKSKAISVNLDWPAFLSLSNIFCILTALFGYLILQ